jgi:hypothetical protein
MALEIFVLILLAALLWADRTHRRREPDLWRIWQALRAGEHRGLDAYELRLLHELAEMLIAGQETAQAQAEDGVGGLRARLGTLVRRVDEWSLRVSGHLFLSLAWWATMRASLPAEPLSVADLRTKRLVGLAAAELALFTILPRSLWISVHARVLLLALRWLPGLFRRLDPAARAAFLAGLNAALADLGAVGEDALRTARRLRDSLAAAGGATAR